jgi:hypothetical protein
MNVNFLVGHERANSLWFQCIMSDFIHNILMWIYEVKFTL